jgi:acyl-CoA thioesterase
MPVRPDMVNGHGVCHGGIVFALGDSAFAFACNSYNDSTVAAAASIDFLIAVRAGDELTAEATEVWRTRRNGIYEISIRNQRGERVALFRGRSYRVDGQVVEEE